MLAQALVDAGVDASMQDYDRRSALHLAASNASIMVNTVVETQPASGVID